MRMKKLAKNKLNDLLLHWSGSYRVLAPIRRENGDCLMESFEPGAFNPDYGKPSLPPKSAFFPQNEVIFTVEKGEYREVLPAGKTLLFGVRACDLMGILQSGSFMTRDRKDPYYDAKRDAVTTVVMACPGPQNETCFCTTMQSGPAAKGGFDLQFYDAGEFFVIESGSARGEGALAGFALSDLDDDLASRQIEAFRQAAAERIERRDSVPEAMQRLKDRTADEKVWESLAKKCILCGGCAFVCPTCTCFNVCDHPTGPGEGIRERTWDACLFGGFTREASGHNPRTTQALRLKRRHEHKLLHYRQDDIQEALCGCTGCGRCSDFCPVHIGTLEVAEVIADADRQEG
jgi:ferredoxin